jgi:hypothetical protein
MLQLTLIHAQIIYIDGCTLIHAWLQPTLIHGCSLPSMSCAMDQSCAAKCGASHRLLLIFPLPPNQTVKKILLSQTAEVGVTAPHISPLYIRVYHPFPPVTAQFLARNFFFRIFNAGRFLYRLGLSIIGTSKTVP